MEVVAVGSAAMIFGIFCWLLLGAWADLQKDYDKCTKENELLAFEIALFEDLTRYYEERLTREERMSDEPR